MKQTSGIKKLFELTWKIAAALVLAALIVFLVLFVPVMGEKLDASKLEVSHSSVAMFAQNGQKMDTTSLNLTQYVKIDDIKPHTYNAFVAIEDKRFFKHNGVDAVRIGSAVFENLKSRSYKEGASTITQQLVKNLYLTNEKNLKRKTKEIALAVQLEKEYSKMEILELYLNTIYFGNNAYGIGQAAKCYFSKSASQLTLAESATLAAIIKAPAIYAPDKDFEKNFNRKNLILSFMHEQGMISTEELENAKREALRLNKTDIHSARLKGYEHAAVLEAAELLNLGVAQVKNSGLQIHTYFDKDKQDALSQAFDADKTKTVSGNEAYKTGLIADNSVGSISAYYGNSLFSLYNQKRQIGSTAKPLAVYAPAFEQNLISPASPVLDEMTAFDGFVPYNANRNYVGWTTVRESLKNSRNTPAVKVFNSLNKSKTAEILDMLELRGADEPINLPMALGTFRDGVSITKLTAGYMCLANGGVYKQLSFIKKIEDENGRILFEHNPKCKRVFRADTAYLTTDILKDVAKSGTAKTLAELNLPVAGKTGTVGQRGKNNSDAIFCAYTPTDTMTLWFFSEQNDLLQYGTNGGTAPVYVAKNVLKSLYTQNISDFNMPETIKKVAIDKILLEEQQKIALTQDIAPQEEQLTEYFSTINLPTTVSERIQIVQEPQPIEEPDIWIPFFPLPQPKDDAKPVPKPTPYEKPIEEKPRRKTFWDDIIKNF